MNTPVNTTIDQVLAHFKKADPVLYKAATGIAHEAIFREDEDRDYFRDLCREIVGQQLSTKAATTIFSRFESLFPDKQITPELLSTFSIEQLREVGLSNAKAKYV